MEGQTGILLRANRMNKRNIKPNQTIGIRNLCLAVAMLQALLCVEFANAQTVEERLTALEQSLQQQQTKNKYLPKLSGILRGKFEYQPDLEKGRFEVRNARLAVSGKLAAVSEYKLEVDLCDEGSVKMKDAWVRLLPYKTLRLSVGQQRMPFSIDAHRNPSAQYFANRSFIAKQVGDMRDVGFQAGYDVLRGNRKLLSLDAGIFNGSNLDNQKTAWFSAPAYSARIQFFPIAQVALVPSIQHQLIAQRQASYTSYDIGAYYETSQWHIEAEFLHKTYGDNAFTDCNAVDAMLIFNQKIRSKHGLVESISYLGRYDWMQDHSSGASGFEEDAANNNHRALVMTDAERHRMTLGATLHLRNPYFPTSVRVNYEKYWYPHEGAKESEQDKIVCEVIIKF